MAVDRSSLMIACDFLGETQFAEESEVFRAWAFERWQPKAQAGVDLGMAWARADQNSFRAWRNDAHACTDETLRALESRGGLGAAFGECLLMMVLDRRVNVHARLVSTANVATVYGRGMDVDERPLSARQGDAADAYLGIPRRVATPVPDRSPAIPATGADATARFRSRYAQDWGRQPPVPTRVVERRYPSGPYEGVRYFVEEPIPEDERS